MGIALVAALAATLASTPGDADAECQVSAAERAEMDRTSARLLALPTIEPQPIPESIVAIEGCVVYRIRVSALGRVAAVVVVRQAGHPKVDAVARPLVMALPYRRSPDEWLGLVRIRVKF